MSQEEEFEVLEPGEGIASPFSVGPVDPLVYRMDDTSPELRAAAAYIPVAPRLTIKEAAPTPPSRRQHASWTPGDADAIPQEAHNAGPGAVAVALRKTLMLLLALVPFAAAGALIWIGISLYR